MRTRPASLFAKAVFVFSLTLLVIVGVFYADAGSGPSSAESLHLTQADWQTTDGSGFQAPPPTVDSASLPNAWQHAALPYAPPIALLRQAGAKAQSGVVHTTWIRIAVPASAWHSMPLALYGVRIKADGTIAVYVNGRLVHRAQERGPLWNSTRTPLWVALDEPRDDVPVREILLRLEHTQRTQVAVSSLWLGPMDALKGRYNVRQWLQQELPAVLSAAFLAIGVFALFVWFRRGHETAYLLFFNLAVTSFLRGLHFYVAQPIANDWFAWLTVNSLLWLVLVVHFFLRQLHGRPLVWFTRTLVMVTVAIDRKSVV